MRQGSGSVVATALLLGIGLLAMPASPVAAFAPTISVSPTSGPVGTVVTVRGDAGPGCTSQNYFGVTFGENLTGPLEAIRPAFAPDGSWSASFVIPPFVAGGTNHSTNPAGTDVTPGQWYFESPPACSGPPGVTTVPFEVTGTFAAQPPSRFVGMAATPDGGGYWLAQAGGGVFSYGDATFHGSLPGAQVVPAAPIVGIAATPDGGGYWIVGQDGGVFAFGDAKYLGSLPADHVSPYGVIVSITPTPDGNGYWLVGANGGVFAFGDATYYCSAEGQSDIGLSATPDGKGYVVFSAVSPTPVLACGDATVPGDQQASGSSYRNALNAGGTLTSDGAGGWVTGTDGGVFASGDAGYFGSLPGLGVSPSAPIVGIVRATDDAGYWLVGADGGVFAFGDAAYNGSAARSGLPWAAR